MLRSASSLAPRGHFVTALQRSDFSWRWPSATRRLGPYLGRSFTGKQSEAWLGTHGVVLEVCLNFARTRD